MPDRPELDTRVRARRQRAGLSQRMLAEQVGITRQALIAIEAGRQVPSTTVSLALGRALSCRVEDLFVLEAPAALSAQWAGGRTGGPKPAVVGRVGGHWVAHPVPTGAGLAADGLAEARGSGRCAVTPLRSSTALGDAILVAGCAPLLGPLVAGVRGPGGVAATWLPHNSRRALDLLRQGLVHVAGLHLPDRGAGDNAPAVRRRFGDRRMLIVNLTRWRQGLVVARGNAVGVRGPDDLARRGLRIVRREPGSGAGKLLDRVARSASVKLASGPQATGHLEVARMVASGAADVGVAIESVALACGLSFVPLLEERFDLVVPAELAEDPPVARLLDALDGAAFRRQAVATGGYDLSVCGHVTTVPPRST